MADGPLLSSTANAGMRDLLRSIQRVAGKQLMIGGLGLAGECERIDGEHIAARGRVNSSPLPCRGVVRSSI
jgi:hypothetical protein